MQSLPIRLELPFDSEHKREVRLTKPIIIEGVSSLNRVLCDLYGLKIFVESDSSTVFRPLSIAAVVRGNENGASFSCRVWTSICGLT